MKEGYYIPEMEEFHIGLEYEVHLSTSKLVILEGKESKQIGEEKEIWNKLIFGGGELGKLNFGISFNFEVVYKDNRIIVKSLDKNDIESLGWKKDSGDLDFILKDYQLEILKNKIIITRGYGEDSIFYGIIKNKSELIRIMKQVGITK